MAKIKSKYALQSARCSNSIAEKIKHLLCGNNALLKLDPFYFKGLMRVGGILIDSALDFDQKHPIILADKDPLTTLLIRHTHFLTLHGGVQSTLCALRTQFWIMRGRNAVRAVINHCHSC